MRYAPEIEIIDIFDTIKDLSDEDLQTYLFDLAEDVEICLDTQNIQQACLIIEEIREELRLYLN